MSFRSWHSQTCWVVRKEDNLQIVSIARDDVERPAEANSIRGAKVQSLENPPAKSLPAFAV